MTLLRTTITWEYDADPENYPDPDPAAMAAVDAQVAPVEAVDFADSLGYDPVMTVEPV